tara:strand:+ start:367 stop:561 length:195 start_codon:yes stop_codon:yes gene_type:complete
MQVIKEQLPVDVYRNQNGDIVICQNDPQQAYHYVVIGSAEAAQLLCEAVLDMANQPDAFLPEDE